MRVEFWVPWRKSSQKRLVHVAWKQQSPSQNSSCSHSPPTFPLSPFPTVPMSYTIECGWTRHCVGARAEDLEFSGIYRVWEYDMLGNFLNKYLLTYWGPTKCKAWLETAALIHSSWFKEDYEKWFRWKRSRNFMFSDYIPMGWGRVERAWSVPSWDSLLQYYLK